MPLSTEDATARAEAEVRAYCGWHIAPVREDDELTLDGPGSQTLVLPSLRVTDIASVTEDGLPVDESAYVWSQSGIIRRSSSTAWPWGPVWTDVPRGLVVVLTHGYEEMPLDVLAVIERVAARAVEVSGASQVLSQVGAVRYAVGVDGLREVGLLSDADRQVLDRYRLPKRP